MWWQKLFDFFENFVVRIKKVVYICNRLKKERARSSVGSEHLVYTQGVRGSNPFAPTSSKNPIVKTIGFFVVEALENEVFRRADTTKNEVVQQLGFLFAGVDNKGSSRDNPEFPRKRSFQEGFKRTLKNQF